jgi:hypothetical protein
MTRGREGRTRTKKIAGRKIGEGDDDDADDDDDDDKEQERRTKSSSTSTSTSTTTNSSSIDGDDETLPSSRSRQWSIPFQCTVSNIGGGSSSSVEVDRQHSRRHMHLRHLRHRPLFLSSQPDNDRDEM